MSRVN